MPAVIAFIAFVVVGLWLFSEELPFQNEITVYQMFCTGEGRKDGKCKSKEETANPITYRAFVDQQTVIYWFEHSAPTRMRNCAVRDAKNWSCQLDDRWQTEYKMIDGALGKTSDNPIQPIFYQASKWRWWSVWLDQRMR